MFPIRLGLVGLMGLLCGCRVQTGLSLAETAGGQKGAVALPAVGQGRGDLLHYDKPLVELISEKPLRKSRVSLRVEKSRYRLTVLYQGKAVKAYPVVLGANPVDDKRFEGDNCTPEGHFRLTTVRPHRSWSRFMLLSYPTPVSWQRFRRAKRDGVIPQDATIGGAVGIHGVPDRADGAIDRRQNWTAGCISLKRHDIEEIYAVCRTGTPVTIVH
jgi:murein L,D-transpeptidase YafK